MPTDNDVNEEVRRYRCCQCGDSFTNLNQFYKSYSTIYCDTGHLPICKTCFQRLYNQYKIEYNSDKRAIQRLCMAFDIYYNEDVFDTCISPDGEVSLGNYIKRLNIKPSKGKTFDATLEEGFYFTGEQSLRMQALSIKHNMPEADPKDIERWGAGLTGIDYQTLNSHYKTLKDSNPRCDNNMEIFILDLCYIKMQQMRAVREGKVDEFNKLTESYRKTFSQAGLKTVNETPEQEDFELGVMIEAIEKYTPAEYYKNKKLYKDFDGIGDYIERMLVRPFRNLTQGTQDRDKEYFVPDDDDLGDVVYDDDE